MLDTCWKNRAAVSARFLLCFSVPCLVMVGVWPGISKELCSNGQGCNGNE